MPLTSAIHESLPYIDTDPTPAERAAAQQLIDSEVTPGVITPHPSLPPLRLQSYSPLMEAEFTRIQNKEPLNAIDPSRYEAAEPPNSARGNKKNSPEDLDAWREALERAQVSQAYLSQRQTNLALLEKFGKNGWLVGNSQLEDVLRSLERELAGRKTEIDGVVLERKSAQESVGPEVKGLEEGWKKGIGRVLETEVAAEEVRGHILAKRREGAQ